VTKITGRSVWNNGAVCCVELTDDDFAIVRRGHDAGFKDLFRDEFQRILAVGTLVTATLHAKGISIAPLEDGERFARTTAK
jgi:hypothetical protein